MYPITRSSARRRAALLGLPLAAGLALVAVPAQATPAAQQVSAACPTGWGSLTKAAPATVTGHLTGVRAGRHACFDRLVVDLDARAPGYRIGYVPSVSMDGSGQPVPLRGGARLAVVVIAPAYDDAGNATYRPANRRELADVTGYSTFRQVAWAGSYEGQSTIGLGVRARLPFRAFTLADPDGGSRLVVDVAHRW